jgi:hypothetical protein
LVVRAQSALNGESPFDLVSPSRSVGREEMWR